MVTYDVGAGLSVHNTFLLDQQSFFGNADNPNFDPNAGDLSIQISSRPMQGNIQIVDGFDFIYNPGPNPTGSATVSWQLMQDGESLGGQQVLVFNFPPSGNGGGGPNTVNANDDPVVAPPLGTGLVDIEFLDWTLSETNSDATLFPTNPDGSGTFGTTLDLSVRVSAYLPGDPAPTGKVIFTATVPNGVPLQIGSATIGVDGMATIQVDSDILATPGTLVEAEYQGDQFFGIRKGGDGNRAANALNNDVQITDNPQVLPNAQNLTVVVVGGDDGAQQLRWAKEARLYYGPDAHLFANIHDLGSLATRLASFPNNSVKKLILTGHGGEGKFSFDTSNTLCNEFSLASLTDDPTAALMIKNALKRGIGFGRIEFQSCEGAKTPEARADLKKIAQMLGVSIKACDRRVKYLDSIWVTWVTINP